MDSPPECVAPEVRPSDLELTSDFRFSDNQRDMAPDDFCRLKSYGGRPAVTRSTARGANSAEVKSNRRHVHRRVTTGRYRTIFRVAKAPNTAPSSDPAIQNGSCPDSISSAGTAEAIEGSCGS